MALRRSLGGEEIALHVEGHDPVPRVLVDVEQRAEDRVGGGVVHQDVEAAEGLESRLEEPVDLRSAPEMGRNRQRPAAERPDLVGDRVEVLCLAGGHDHVGARLGEAEGDRAADAPAAARDHRDAAVESKLRIGHAAI